jgi:2'-5' RNA ligase
VTETLSEGSALIVEVPKAEPIVAPWRLRHDPVAAVGIPAHVTILYPLAPPMALDAELDAALAAFAGAREPFEVVFSDIRRFPDTVWLAPEAGSGFDALIAGAIAAFPAFPPYEGRFPDPVPHLTIGQGTEAEMDALFTAVSAGIADELPLRARVDRLSLFVTLAGRWERRRSYRLG